MKAKQLVSCRECGRQISHSANACPGCGAETSRARGKRSLSVVVLLLIGLGGYFYWEYDQGQKAKAAAEKSYKEAIEASDRFLDSQGR